MKLNVLPGCVQTSPSQGCGNTANSTPRKFSIWASSQVSVF